jgi:hypothetical protein
MLAHAVVDPTASLDYHNLERCHRDTTASTAAVAIVALHSMPTCNSGFRCRYCQGAGTAKRSRHRQTAMLLSCGCQLLRLVKVTKKTKIQQKNNKKLRFV